MAALSAFSHVPLLFVVFTPISNENHRKYKKKRVSACLGLLYSGANRDTYLNVQRTQALEEARPKIFEERPVNFTQALL